MHVKRVSVWKDEDSIFRVKSQDGLLDPDRVFAPSPAASDSSPEFPPSSSCSSSDLVTPRRPRRCGRHLRRYDLQRSRRSTVPW
jgi:hypothetical protein